MAPGDDGEADGTKPATPDWAGVTDTSIDCLIVGGGPAGLTAAIYLARFHLSVMVVDAGDGRCAAIPRTHNHAGFPGGIAGRELLDRMRDQARLYGADVRDGRVDRLERDGMFAITLDGRSIGARAVLLATGVRNRPPPMASDTHDAALARGLLRYCPICDGYEVTDRRVAVLGTGDHGTQEALFLRGFTRDITLVAPDADHALSPRCREQLDEAGVEVLDGPCGDLTIQDDNIVVPVPGGARSFDTLYPALGSDIHSRLAVDLGAEATDDGCLTVDRHQRTTVPGLYAAGDVVAGLDQISAAMGQAGIAATAIRNDLADRAPIRR